MTNIPATAVSMPLPQWQPPWHWSPLTRRRLPTPTAPTTSIASPAGGTTGSTVSVSVNASDNVGVTRVDLYAGTTLVGSVSASPYAFSLNTMYFANGALNLIAYAYDQAGNKGTSTTATVNVSNLADTIAPTVAIVNPIAGSQVSGTVSVKLSSNDNVAVTVLSLRIDSKLVRTSNSGALSYSWNTRKIARGTHTIGAMAEDTAGNITNKSITVTR